MTQHIVAADNPDLANAITERILAGEPVEETPPPAPEPELMKAPSDGAVDLPCGFIDTEADELIREAEVRELNGFDEEALSRASTPSQAVQTLLERAVVRIGEKKPSRDSLDALLSGDVDALVVGIYRATYGDTVDFRPTCPACNERVEVDVHLVNDVEVTRLTDASDRQFTVNLKRGSAECRLPDWATQREVSSHSESSEAEQTSVFLKNCVTSINGMPVLGLDTVRGLSIVDRRTLAEEISERMVGPQMMSVHKPCPECGDEIYLPVGLDALFQYGS